MAQYREGQTARNPQTGETLVYSGGRWASPNAGGGAGGGIITKPADPLRPGEAVIQGQTIAANERKAATAAALEPLKVKQAQLAIRNAELAIEKAEREARTGNVKADAKLANLDALTNQINRVQELYAADIAPTGGVSGILDYLPNSANRRFNTAGAGLAEQGLAAFRVPGVGSQSDTELRQFVEANRPSASDFDAQIEEKLRQLRGRVDATRSQMGLDPAQWSGQGPDRATPPAAPPTRLNDQEFMVELDRLIKAGDRSAVDAFLAAQGAKEKEPGQIDAALAAGRGNVQRPETVDAAGGFAYGLGDMATLGFLDEAGAVVNSIIPHEGRPNIFQSGVGLGDAYSANLQANRDLLNVAQEQQGPAFLAGQVAGGIAGAAGLAKSAGGMFGRVAPRLMGGGKKAAAARTVAGESAFGSGYGAGSGTEGDRVSNAAIGAVAAPAGGLAGRAAVTGAGRALSPVVSPAVRRLADAGITMTPGQIMRGSGTGLGKAIGWTEDKAMSLPLVGDAIRAARQRQMPQFQRASINEALKPLGKEVPKEMIGNEAVDYAQDVVSRAYDDALIPLRAAPDDQLQAAFNAIGTQADDLPEAQRQLYASVLQRDIIPFMPKDGVFTGKQIQGIKRGLDRHIGKLAKGSPADQMLADTLSNVRSEVMDFAARVAPAEAGGFRKANEAFARLARVNSAAAMAPEGLFSPQQLRTAVRQGDKTSNKRATAAGNALMQDFATDASAVLPSGVPNSGTTDRALLALGTVGGGAAVSPPLLAGYSATALPYLPVLDRATQKLLIGRPDILEKAGRELVRRRGVGGMFAGPLAVSAGVGNN